MGFLLAIIGIIAVVAIAVTLFMMWLVFWLWIGALLLLSVAIAFFTHDAYLSSALALVIMLAGTAIYSYRSK